MKQLYIPITKVDATQRMVYGTMALETADKSGEILDYAGSKPLFEQWSQGIAETTGGKSYGNVRAMHGKVAAGRLAQPISYDDEGKRMDCVAHVVDDAEWAKVQEGVYTGFSIGGKYVKRWSDGDLTRYVAEPFEVSLVDLPCIPGANFQFIKAEGATEDRPFTSVQPTETDPPMTTEAQIPNDVLFAKAEELAKAAGSAVPTDFLDAARAELSKAAELTSKSTEAQPEMKELFGQGMVEITAPEPTEEDRAVEQVWKARDGSTFAKKADAIKRNMELAAPSAAAPLTAAIDALAAKVAKAAEKAAGGPAEAEAAQDAAEAPEAAEAAPVAASKPRVCKSLDDVATLAAIIEGLSWVQRCLASEAEFEGDNSPVPAALKANIGDLVETFKALAAEEADEVLGGLAGAGEDDDALALSADGALAKLAEFVAANEALAKHAPVLEKAGARHSKKDAERVQSVHDHSVDLGAKCAEGGADKAAEGDLAKAAHDALKAENAELRSTMETLTKTVEGLTKTVETVLNTPAPQPPARLLVVDKGTETATSLEHIEKMARENPQALALAFIKDEQSRPRQAFRRG